MVVLEAVGRWLRVDAAVDWEWTATVSGHFVPCRGLAATGWKMFVRPGFSYCSSEVLPAEEGPDSRCSSSAGHDRLTIRQRR